ncbi:MAG: hypothetical protein GF418_06285 [Chitinivibrionales bacterium]|nr:hypothetical protein [Chitinivibrionales bacterium]MBD3395219.1 hypothetical protein [Chitinivibrionales bacterium]
MPVTIDRRPDQDLSILTATGVVTNEQMFAAQNDLYAETPTLLHLWDMTRASLERITVEGVREFAEKATTLGKARKGGRTAVVAGTDLQYGLARMSEAFGTVEDRPYELRLFKKRAEAMAWLTGPG